MSGKRKARNYVVRGFDFYNNSAGRQSFSSAGVMEDHPDFTEEVFKTQADAIIYMLTGSIGSMSPSYVRADPDNYNEIVEFGNGGGVNELAIINLTINTNAQSVRDLRPAKTELREVLKRWAEKCRVRGVRGWRANAIKDPVFERTHGGQVQVRTQLILSTAVFYDEDTVTIGYPGDLSTFSDDTDNLVWRLKKINDLQYAGLFAEHNKFGSHQVI